MKKKTVTELDYKELETLVKKHLGFAEYNFVAVEECGNNSSHEFTVDEGEGNWFDAEEHAEDIAEWTAGEFPRYTNGTILNELCIQGHIEPGEYIVTVCW
jgi:hypothetical protein